MEKNIDGLLIDRNDLNKKSKTQEGRFDQSKSSMNIIDIKMMQNL